MESGGQQQPNMTKPTWKSTFPMQRLQPGLKALLSASSESKLRCITRTDTFSSSQSMSLSSSEKGKEIEGEEEGEEEVVECLSRRQKWRNEWRKREFPPPMPMVVKTEKTSASQVPWVLKKYSYGENGRDEGGGNRVVIVEKRVKRQEYFRAHRANGHLILQLICVDVDVDDDDDDDDDDENIKEDETLRVETDNVEQEYYETDETEEEEPDDHEIDPTVQKVPVMALASSVPELSARSESDGGGASGKCWTVSSSVGGRSNSDLFRMAIPTMRPIHG